MWLHAKLANVVDTRIFALDSQLNKEANMPVTLGEGFPLGLYMIFSPYIHPIMVESVGVPQLVHGWPNDYVDGLLSESSLIPAQFRDSIIDALNTRSFAAMRFQADIPFNVGKLSGDPSRPVMILGPMPNLQPEARMQEYSEHFSPLKQSVPESWFQMHWKGPHGFSTIHWI